MGESKGVRSDRTPQLHTRTDYLVFDLYSLTEDEITMVKSTGGNERE